MVNTSFATCNPIADLRCFLARKLNHARTRAKKKDVNITVEYLLSLWKTQNGRCAITGYPMTYPIPNLFAASIDRIDSKQGYVAGNVQLVCQCINFGKNHYSNEDMLRFWNFRKYQKENALVG